MIDKEHWPAIAFYLSQQHKDRGYRGTVPSGTFVGEAPELETDAPSVHRGSKVIDGELDEGGSQ